MSKRNLKTIAAAVKAAAKGSVFVFASRDSELLGAADALGAMKKLEYASFKCTACDTSMVAEANSEPFCVTCGTHKVEQVGAKAEMNVTSDAELVAVTCNHCQSHNVIQASVFKATGGHMSCANCGTEIAADLEPAQPDGPAKFGTDNVEPTDLKVPTQETKTGETAEAGEDPAKMDGTEQPDLKVPDQPETAADDELEVEELEMSEHVEPDGDEFVSPEDFDEESASEDEEIEVEEAEADEDEPLPFEEDSAGDPVMDAMDMDDSDVALSFVKAHGRLVAMKGPITVATLTKAAAGTNAEVMFTDAMQKAVRMEAAKSGLRKALATYQFKPIRVKAMTKATVVAEVKKVKASIQQDQESKQKVFEESLAIASVGLSRNGWKNTPNTLMDAMVTELSSLGVPSAKRIVARMFAQHGVEYTKTLLEVASKVAAKSADSRRELAENFDMLNEEIEEDETSEVDDLIEDDVDFDSVTSRFSTPVTATVQKTVSKVTSAAQDVLNRRAPLQFFN
jgi:hypothetical protein